VECETIVEAAMAYFSKHRVMPDNIYTEENGGDVLRSVSSMREQLLWVVEQRDEALEQISKLHDLAQAALAAVNLPLEGGKCE
jgi:hypothetical protein